MPGTPDGGAILCNGASPSILNCIFIDNSADLGGAVNVVDGNPTFTNCAFIRNSATGNGGGMNNDNSGPILTNCTFADNAASSGGGLYNANGSTPTLANCIVWGDIPDAIVDVTGASSTVRYSDVQGVWPGKGNITVDPLFADIPAGDYRLSAGSPAIDAADNDSVPVGLVADLDGLPRFLDDPEVEDTGEGFAPLVDMGAYEFQAGAGGCVRDPAWICDGDVDGNGQVNPVDGGIVQSNFGNTSNQALCNYDIDCDGQINPVDAGIVQSLFGTCEAPREVCP